MHSGASYAAQTASEGASADEVGRPGWQETAGTDRGGAQAESKGFASWFKSLLQCYGDWTLCGALILAHDYITLYCLLGVVNVYYRKNSKQPKSGLHFGRAGLVYISMLIGVTFACISARTIISQLWILERIAAERVEVGPMAKRAGKM